MRVVVASRIYEPEAAAAAFRLRAAVNALHEAGAEVEVLTVRAPRNASASTPVGGVRVRRWPVLRDRNQYVRGYLPYLSFDVPLFFRLLLARRPDVVLVEPPPTTGLTVRLVCALRRVPYVAYLPDVWSDGAEGAGAPGVVVRVVRWMERTTLRNARRVIAVTPQIAGRARSLAGLDAGRTAVVRNGIDTTTFTPDGPVPAERPGGPYAVYAGTVSEWQGADVFLRAWPRVVAQVPDATLVFLGHGSGGDELHRLRAELGDLADSVRLLPLLPAAEAAAWQRGAHVTLTSMRPGQRYDYFLPTKIFAGAASGAPVLYVGPGPGGRLVTEHALGEAVEHDADAVARALVRMLAADVSPQTRTRIARWARDHADITRTGAQAAAVILDAARAGRAGAMCLPW